MRSQTGREVLTVVSVLQEDLSAGHEVKYQDRHGGHHREHRQWRHHYEQEALGRDDKGDGRVSCDVIYFSDHHPGERCSSLRVVAGVRQPLMVVRLPAQLWTVLGGVGGAPERPFWVESPPVVTTHGWRNQEVRKRQ